MASLCYDEPVRNVLLVEDDAKLARLLSTFIGEDGFAVETVCEAESLTRLLGQVRRSDVVVLDRMLGDHDSKTLLRELKEKWQDVPVLVISAINTPSERTELINMGADDYLGKPFATEEFLARLKALVRRIPTAKVEVRKIGNAVLDLRQQKISVGENSLELPRKEFLLLEALSEQRRVISRPELLELIWGNINLAERNLVEATITNLRRRLASLQCGFKIMNQRSLGYWIED